MEKMIVNVAEEAVEKAVETTVEEAAVNAVQQNSGSGTGVAIAIGAVGAVTTIFVVKGAIKLGKKAIQAGKEFIAKRKQPVEVEETIEAEPCDAEETSEE